MTLIPFIEKFRPKTFEEVVGVKELEKIKTLIASPENMPNLMFYGPAGTGKTTMAKIILNNLNPIDYIKINGSDTTGVDTVRETIYNFITSKSTISGKPKIVWIEEFDYMSHNAFASLRSMIEQYMSNARFIVTANYLTKIPDPIQSRFTKIEFTRATPDKITSRIKHICEVEEITCADDVLEQIIKFGKGDIRTVVNAIQYLSANETKTISCMSLAKLDDISKKVYGLIIDKQWSKIRYDIPQEHPNYEELLVSLENMFFKSDFSIGKKAAITEIISDTLDVIGASFDKPICFSACCSRIIKEI